jgi:hypothetical protein
MTVELETRSSLAFEVSLLWEPAANELWVDVLHPASGERFEIPTTPDRAQDAFWHPFAYALRAA